MFNNFDNIPWVVTNTFGIIILIISICVNTRKLLRKLNFINTKIDNQMTNEQQMEQRFMDAFSRIDTATNSLAAEFRKMQDELKAQPGLDEGFTNSFITKLEDAAQRMEAIGSSPDNPTPGVVGSTTPIPLGSGISTDTTVSVETTPPSNPTLGIGNDADQQKPDNANGTIPDDDKKEGSLPGDTTVSLNDIGSEPQVGKQPDANNGDTNTNPNTDSNPNNDEVIPGADVPATSTDVPATSTDVPATSTDVANTSDVATTKTSKKSK